MEAVVVMRSQYSKLLLQGKDSSDQSKRSGSLNDCVYGRRTKAVTVHNTTIHITQTYEAGGLGKGLGVHGFAILAIRATVVFGKGL